MKLSREASEILDRLARDFGVPREALGRRDPKILERYLELEKAARTARIDAELLLGVVLPRGWPEAMEEKAGA